MGRRRRRRGDPRPARGGLPRSGLPHEGIEDPAAHYYRRAITDAALAVDAARALLPGVPVFLTGASQGGGLAIAAAALSDGVAGVLPDVPFLCDFPRATRIVDTLPYREVRDYLAAHRDRVEQAFRTLSYFDAVTLAAWASAPALFSAALMDPVCPPSTVFAAFNSWGSTDKSIEVYPFNGHEGGASTHRALQLSWLTAKVGI